MKYNFTLYGTTSVSAIGQKWNTINYADLISKCTGLPFSNPGWSDGNEVWQNWMYVVKHCKPFLQDSPALGLVDPAWAKCDQRVAMYDPPRALIPGRALGPAPPAPTRDTSVSAAAAVAAPASQAAKPVPTLTPAPSISAPVSPSKSDPLSGNSNDPESAKDSAANNPQANKDPAVVAQNPKGGPADETRSQSTDSQPAEPAPALAPSVTTIAAHSIQVPAAQSSVGIVLVDGQSITAGHDPTTVSSTQIALHTNGDLVLGTSTVQNFLPTNPPALVKIPSITTGAGHALEIAPSQLSWSMVNPSQLAHLQQQDPAHISPSTPTVTLYSAYPHCTASSLPHPQLHCPTSQSAAKPSPSPHPTSSLPAPPTHPETLASQSTTPSSLSILQHYT